MTRARVLVDTNILISGLIFTKGNEHEILRLIERRRLALILPDSVLIEARRVLAEKSPGFEVLLDVFVRRVDARIIPLQRILPHVKGYRARVRDRKDTPLYAAIALAKPMYAVTGDQALREDLRRSPQIRARTMVCASKQLLDRLRRE